MKKWTYKTDNKMRALGETNFEKKQVRVNKKAHKKMSMIGGYAKQDRTLINTIVHEKLHVDHPKMHEKTVRKLARKRVSKLGEREKKKLYSKLS